MGAEYLNTMTEANDVVCRTVSFGVVVAIICWVCSLPRTFDMLSRLGTASAFFTFVSVLLATIFAAVQAHPAGFDLRSSYTKPDGTTSVGGNPIVTAVPVVGTTFVNGLGAFLNISYTFIGQITLPSFIAEMKDPRDFPKALWACTIAEIILFSVVGSVVYVYVGNQYMTAPAFGSLEPLFKKLSFSFMIPTIIFLGVLYASVSARFIFFRIFQNSHHKNEHTVVGWASWASILSRCRCLAIIFQKRTGIGIDSDSLQWLPGSPPSSLLKLSPSSHRVSIIIISLFLSLLLPLSVVASLSSFFFHPCYSYTMLSNL